MENSNHDINSKEFISCMQQMQNEVNELFTAESFSALIKEAVVVIRNFEANVNGVHITKEKEETIENLLFIKRMVVTELVKNEHDEEKADQLVQRIRDSVTSTIDKFIIFIKIL